MNVPRRSGFVLIELLAVILLGVIVISIAGKLLVDSLYLLRIAGDHADRVAVMDTLEQHLREDTLSADSYDWDGAALRLSERINGEDTLVSYFVEADHVLRTSSRSAALTWSAARLQIAARVEHGPRLDSLLLEFVERPPKRATGSPNREFTVSILLPASARAEEPPGEAP